MKKLLIVGVGGNGQVIAEVALAMNAQSELCFLDNNEILKSVFDITLLATQKLLRYFPHKNMMYLC